MDQLQSLLNVGDGLDFIVKVWPSKDQAGVAAIIKQAVISLSWARPVFFVELKYASGMFWWKDCIHKSQSDYVLNKEHWIYLLNKNHNCNLNRVFSGSCFFASFSLQAASLKDKWGLGYKPSYNRSKSISAAAGRPPLKRMDRQRYR